MKTIVTVILILSSLTLTAQTRISGTVKARNNTPVRGANISLVNTYDGATADSTGNFSFSSSEKGKQLLRFTAVGFVGDSVWLDLDAPIPPLNVQLKEAINELNLVTITAGTLETGDSKKGSVLSSLDVATTAGAVADIVAALQTLPGTAQAFGENGLFVRGGSGQETQSYFDGMTIKNPFGSQLPNMHSRNRFSPFLFKGTTFSSGGYSAQYGQALSSALLMESKDLPEKSSTELSAMSVGGSAAHTHKMENSSLMVGAKYYDLKPNYALIKQDVNWLNEPVEMQGMIQYKWKPSETGILKVFGQYNNTKVALMTGDNFNNPARIKNSNAGTYLNTTYQDYISDSWKIQGGVSYNHIAEDGFINTNQFRRTDELLQGRFTLTNYFGRRSLIRFGAEASANKSLEGWNTLSRSFDNAQRAGFAESEIYFGNALVARIGLRSENSSFLDQWALAPRVSMAVKAGKRGNFSLAYGTFHQNPNDSYLMQSTSLKAEKADHYILNYQYITDHITFRTEAYYKNYTDLVKYDFNGFVPAFGIYNYDNLNNGGKGYARGIDFFFRDKKTIPAGDYWISYSYLDTKRDFRNYPAKATPPFAAKHTLNVVYKQYIPHIKSEIGTTYSFSSGRTYFNPNNTRFLADRTKTFNNLSLNVSYLTRVFNQFAVVYASVTNVPGFENIYGYDYSMDGSTRSAILPPAKRNVLLGLLVTIGDNTFNH